MGKKDLYDATGPKRIERASIQQKNVFFLYENRYSYDTLFVSVHANNQMVRW